MKKFASCLILLVLLISISSCVVTNNLYINDPAPQGKGNYKSYMGIGTGTWLLGDSTIILNDKPAKYFMFPEAALGFKYGVGPKTNLHLAMHVPLTISGLGLKIGFQQSFFEANAPFNLALGADIGGTIAGNKIFGISFNENENRGAFNADFFMPLSLKFNESLKLIMTPRYSFNTYFVSQKNIANFTVMSAGISYKKNLFEASVLFNNEYFLPRVGYIRNF
ncbi:MAG: hypothetical protein ACOYOA_15965 [Saprospiraceae bacterium]